MFGSSPLIIRFCARHLSSSTSRSRQGLLLADLRRTRPKQLDAFSKTIETHRKQISDRFSAISKNRMAIVEDIEQTVCLDSVLVPVGSFGSGLLTANSDIDLCLLLNESRPNRRNDFEQKFMYSGYEFRKKFMNNVFRLISNSKKLGQQIDWTKSQVIPQARVPVIALHFKSGLCVDIQFGNERAIRNTNLVKHYVMADERFGQLNMWAQHWLTALKAKNSLSGKLSSYHISMLVVHFLQCSTALSNPVLPVLTETHPDLVGPNLALDDVIITLLNQGESTDFNWKSKCKLRVGDLAVHMVDYYSKIDLHEMGFNIANGTCEARRIVDYGRLHIIDPFERDSVCRGASTLEAFQHALRVTANAFSVGHLLAYPLTEQHIREASAGISTKNAKKFLA